jgi:hypothetical protein
MGLLEQRAESISGKARGFAMAEGTDAPSLGFDPITILMIVGLIFQIIRCIKDARADDVRRPGMLSRLQVRRAAARRVGWRQSRHVARAIIEDAATLTDEEWEQARVEGLAWKRRVLT